MPASGADARSTLKLLAGEGVMCLRKTARVTSRRDGSRSALAIPRTKSASSLRTLTSTRIKPSAAKRLRHCDVLDWPVMMTPSVLRIFNENGTVAQAVDDFQDWLGRVIRHSY